jgi:error-prone DNA polymerase
VGFNNPKMPWSELERRLSWGKVPGPSHPESRHRQPYEPPPAVVRRRGAVPYAELHCHTNFSFLDGASHPEELVEEAARLGLEALAVTDHDGMYGVVRFAQAAHAVGMPTVFGAELTLDLPRRSQAGLADPEGRHVVVLARDPSGYARLCRTISQAQMGGGEKGLPKASLSALAQAHGGHWLVLTGCRKGMVPAALHAAGPAAAARELADLVAVFGRENVAVELWDHGDPLDSARNDALVNLAARAGVDVLATNNVHYATPARRPLATALAAVRARRSLDEIDGWLPGAATAHLRSGAEQARRFVRYPGVVERAAELGRACAFDLRLVAPNLPDYPVPPGHTEMTWLRHLAYEGAERRYGPRAHERVPGAWDQIDHELAMIEALGFPGYFLIVWDIVEFCRRENIYCQGRGSAANSAVCYAIGITNADAVNLGLLFERFLSPERDGPPDIDLDIEHERREEAIQYVYNHYGRDNAAQVANVITYRPKSAIRDMGKAFGHPPGQLDAWSKHVEGWFVQQVPDDAGIPDNVLVFAKQVEGFPRHLGIHSGGMVICDRPVVEVCPVEWGRMEGRTVLQWDKDDCAAAGLVKIDLLGLGMLTVLHLGVDFIRDHYGVEVDLATIPQEDAVYDMLCEADSVGVFQVESRAQMATLPRLKPRTFYDLVVEVALIRPGPIQGGSVHPYIRRRNGQEEVTYLHPLLEKSLAKTLGVPLFQEQLMQMAIDVAGFSPAESDQLRQAMGSKRSHERMERLRARLLQGMAERGITGDTAEQIYDKLAAFADFGFPESHSVSFAYLVYSSAWMKLHYPAAFLAALLNAQPMGFYSPNTLVADSRRHGVELLGPDVNLSGAKATLEKHRSGDDSLPYSQSSVTRTEEPAVRLGLDYVRSIGDELADKIEEYQPYESVEDLVRRTGATQPAVEALATAGAFGSLGHERREALWGAGAASQTRPDRLEGIVTGTDAPQLPGMADVEVAAADLWATGVSVRHPMEFVRHRIPKAVTIAELQEVADGTRVTVGGVVTHRQRPSTAQGTVFVNLEDETGILNVICSEGVWARYRKVARASAALLVRGMLERTEGVTNLVAERIEALPLATQAARARDFR